MADLPIRPLPSQVKAGITALGVLAAAVIAALPVLGAVGWNTAQTAGVTAFAAAVFGLATAVSAHYWPGTKKEPVGIAAAVTAAATTTVALGNLFAWWTLTAAQVSALLAVVSAAVGVVTALVARNHVAAQANPPTTLTPRRPGHGSPGRLGRRVSSRHTDRHLARLRPGL